jgi:osmotically-inducible protein OsmY
MSRRAAWLAALASAAALLQGCEVALLGAATYVTVEDRRSSDTQIDDQAIEIRAANRISERFGRSTHVSVTSFNRTVLLTGEVPDEGVRGDVEKIVLGVPNVRRVSNEVQVGETSSFGARTSDATITMKVKGRMLDAPKVNGAHVKVVTEGAAVYLLGIVTEAEADDAVDIARTTGGVRKVVKLFEYCTPADEICSSRPRPVAKSQRAP